MLAGNLLNGRYPGETHGDHLPTSQLPFRTRIALPSLCRVRRSCHRKPSTTKKSPAAETQRPGGWDRHRLSQGCGRHWHGWELARIRAGLAHAGATPHRESVSGHRLRGARVGHEHGRGRVRWKPAARLAPRGRRSPIVRLRPHQAGKPVVHPLGRQDGNPRRLFLLGHRAPGEGARGSSGGRAHPVVSGSVFVCSGGADGANAGPHRSDLCGALSVRELDLLEQVRRGRWRHARLGHRSKFCRPMPT